MIRSRVFIVLAIALFLAGCFCAEAAALAVNSKEKAVQDVKTLKELTAGVLSRAESNAKEAESTKSTVESQNTKAVNAESDAKKAAQTITADKRKTQADAVAKKATEELGNCDKLYNTAKEKADQASKSLNGFVASAKALVQNAQIVIPDALNPPGDYTNVIQNAAAVTGQTKALSGEIQKSTDLNTAKIALSALREGTKKVQVLKYQAESLVIVSNIEAKLKASETDIQSIHQKKNEIDAIVKEMNQNLQSASGTSTSVLSSLCSTAEGQLRTAANKVREANKCKEDIVSRKAQLDQDLETLMDRTDEETDAGQDAGKVKWHATDIDGEIAKIQAALLAAGNALSNAKKAQQQMRETISKHNSQSGSEIIEERKKDSVPTTEVTNHIQNGAAKNPAISKTVNPTAIKTDKPAITETDQTALETSKDTINKTSAQPVNTHLDKTEQTKSTELTDKQKQNPKDDNSELLNKDELRNITKDITNNPLIGAEVPTRSAANDSAVTVFIPLLVILVISAVLH